MNSIQVISYLFICLMIITSCAPYNYKVVDKYNMSHGQGGLEKETDNYQYEYTYFVHGDSSLYKLTAPQFYRLGDSVSVTGILMDVDKDVLSDNLLEKEEDKILHDNKYNRAHYFVLNDTLLLNERVITLTDKDLMKMTIYSFLTREEEASKTAVILLVSGAVAGLITWIVIELSTLKISLNLKG